MLQLVILKCLYYTQNCENVWTSHLLILLSCVYNNNGCDSSSNLLFVLCSTAVLVWYVFSTFHLSYKELNMSTIPHFACPFIPQSHLTLSIVYWNCYALQYTTPEVKLVPPFSAAAAPEKEKEEDSNAYTNANCQILEKRELSNMVSSRNDRSALALELCLYYSYSWLFDSVTFIVCRLPTTCSTELNKSTSNSNTVRTYPVFFKPIQGCFLCVINCG